LPEHREDLADIAKVCFDWHVDCCYFSEWVGHDSLACTYPLIGVAVGKKNIALRSGGLLAGGGRD